MNTRLLRLVVLFPLLALAACGDKSVFKANDNDKEAIRPAFTRFPDLPMPQGAKVDIDRSLVLGSGESWYGQLVIDAGTGPYEMFDFFKQEMSRFGWQEITSLRAPTSVLSYSRQGRVATLQIRGNTIRGSEVTVTVSPGEGGTPLSAGGPPPRSSGAGGGVMPAPVERAR